MARRAGSRAALLLQPAPGPLAPPERHFHRIYLALLAADALLIAANLLLVAGVRSGSEFLNRQFDLAHEGNLAAWYSSALLMLAGVIALTVVWLHSLRRHPARRDQPARAWKRLLRPLGWVFVGVMLLALSADEIAQVHEWLGNRAPHHLGAGQTVLGLDMAFRWLLVFAPLILAGAALLVWFAVACLHGRARTLALIGVACWVGTIAAEYVESIQWRNGWTRGVQVPIEEGLEVVGTTLFLIAFIEALRQALGIASPATAPTPAAATPTPRAAAAPA